MRKNKTTNALENERVLSGHVTKSCTTCLQELPPSDFYSKGNRQDTICKSCKKEKSKATYLRTKKTINFSHLNRFIELMMELELRRLRDFEMELASIIDERNKNYGQIKSA